MRAATAPEGSVDKAAECRGEPAKVAPVVDRNRCEAKAACVGVCPYNVFEIRRLAAEDRSSLSLRGKLKAWVHGNRQAFVARPDDCHACGLCVKACPESAIALRSRAAGGA